MKTYLVFLTLILSQTIFAQMEEVKLWPNEIPNSIVNNDYKEINIFEGPVLIRAAQISVPTLRIYKPKNPNGTAVIIFPGGGYKHLSMKKEGSEMAEKFNSVGITAFVVKYRLPSDIIMTDKSLGPLQDAQEAVRFVRKNSAKYKLDLDKIGVIGFSAGGHLAGTLCAHSENNISKNNNEINANPDFCILIYPVISMTDSLMHKGSRKALLGVSPSAALIQKFSLELNNSKSIPKTFIVHASDDKSVPVVGSVQYYLSLKNRNIPTEMFLFQNGGHGFGLGNSESTKLWFHTLILWLEENNFLIK